MFDIFESLFGSSPPSSSSKVAPEIEPSDATTKRRISEKDNAPSAIAASRASRSSNGNSVPRRGRQEQRDRSASHTLAIVASQSCPPPIHRCSGDVKERGKQEEGLPHNIRTRSTSKAAPSSVH